MRLLRACAAVVASALLACTLSSARAADAPRTIGAAPAGVKLAPATPGAVRFTVSVPAATFLPASGEAGVTRLGLEGYDAAARPGEPAIPTRTLLVAVPPVGDVRLTAVASEVIASEGITLSPGLGLDSERRPVKLGRNPAAYGRAGHSTPVAARLVGVSWLRNQRVAQIVIEPVAYEPALRRLHVAARIDVEIAVGTPGTFGPPAEPEDPFEAVYQASLVNYEQGRTWRRPSTQDLARAARRFGASAVDLAPVTVPPDTSLYVGRDWIKIAIQKTGFYAVNFSRLRSLSFFVGNDTTKLDSLRLFTWPGRPVLPEASYCDSCDYREVAIGIVRDVSPPPTGSTTDGPADGKFSSNNDAFYFFAQGPDGWANDYDAASDDTTFVNHPYEKSNYYYLTIGTFTRPVRTERYPGPPLRIGVVTRSVDPTIGTSTPAPTVVGRQHFEQDLEYWPDAASIRSTYPWEKWFWRSLVPGQSFPFTFDLPDAETTLPARFRLRHWGLSTNWQNCFANAVDHQLNLAFNTVTFPRQDWNGATSLEGGLRTYDTTGTFLRRVSNSLTVSVPFRTVPGCPEFLDRSGLAFFELYYDRVPIPVNDEIDFRTKPGNDRFRYDIGPFQQVPSSFVFDITDPLKPVLLKDALTTGPTGPSALYTLSLADTQSVSHRYYVVRDAKLTSNSEVLPLSALSSAPGTSNENLRSVTQGADYLVIYYDGFATAAESLAVWRRTRLPLLPGPFVTKKVPISALYDQFSGGRTDPGAIRNFLRAASDWSRRPLYVTFLGDASFDYKDITGRAVPGQPSCLLPTFENNFDSFPTIYRQYATDDWLVNVDNPVVVLPDYLAGRIPAGDAVSALDVVRKILAYERSAPFGEYRNTAILFADDQNQASKPPDGCDPLTYDHVDQTNGLNLNHTPAEVDRAYVYCHTFPEGPGSTRPGARTKLFAELNRGAALLNYVGHGSPFKMTDEGVFLDSDAGTLVNGLKLPLLCAASCDVGKFNDPTVQSLGERVLMSASGGCVGVISATEQALSTQNSSLNGLVYDFLFRRAPLTVAGQTFPGNGQYQVPVSAALLAGKTLGGGATNSQKYQLMGDAATMLNLPKLWTEIALKNEAGQPISQFQSGQLVRFEGQVLDQPGGTPVSIDGVASVLIEDSAPTNIVPDRCVEFIPVQNRVRYRFEAGPMYHGDVTLTGGRFSGSFIVPLDALPGTEGRARAYVVGREATAQEDGAGSLRVPVVPGAAPAGDEDGPRITLSFVGGSTSVRPDATLQINLFDQSGIMTTGHAAVNSIIVMVDGNTTSRVDVTSTFRYAADSHQSGTASFQLPGLSAGAHTVQVTAADNFATGINAGLHRSRASLEFQVVDTPPLRIARTFLFPNPVQSGGARPGGVFVVDAPGDSINTQIRVYTVAGKLVRVLRQFGGIGQVQVAWDGRDEEGEALAQGTYLYKVYVSGREADGKSSARQKATAEGRIVVLGP